MSFAGIFLLVSFISALSILLLTPLAERFGLVDVPNSQRKFHDGHIPLIGGVSIYAGLVMGISLFITPDTSSLTYLACSSLLVALGIADDAKDLSPKFRLLVQSVVAVMMCSVDGMHLQSLGNIFGSGDINLGMAGYAVTVLAVIGAINAFNMIDGIDGLLGISSLVTFVSMGILFYLNNDTTSMNLALIISVALVPYLVANLGLSRAMFKKIFMGDTGSMLIGFTVVWLLVQGTHATQESTGNVAFSASAALWLIAFPLMDMVRVIGSRVLRGNSPLNADRSHLHHLLQDTYGDSKRVALMKICTLSAFFAVVGIAMHVTGVREVIIFLTFLMGFALYAFRVSRLKSKI